MSIIGRLFGGDAATVDILAKQLSEAAIERSQNPSAASIEAYATARNAYIAAAPDSPMAQQQRQPAADTRNGVTVDTASAEYAAWYDSQGW